MPDGLDGPCLRAGLFCCPGTRDGAARWSNAIVDAEVTVPSPDVRFGRRSAGRSHRDGSAWHNLHLYLRAGLAMDNHVGPGVTAPRNDTGVIDANRHHNSSRRGAVISLLSPRGGSTRLPMRLDQDHLLERR